MYMYVYTIDLENVAVGAEEVEDVVTVELALSKAVQHQHRPSTCHGRRSHHIILPCWLGGSCMGGR